MDATEPRPAATVLLLRDDAAGLAVFMVRRHRAMGFAGDALVFPGGRIDEGDLSLASQAALCPAIPNHDSRAMAFRVGALRETFEEGGILLARDQATGRLVSGERAKELGAHRAAIAAGSLAFAALLAREKLELAPDLLVPFAHWITPPIYTRRYDTKFFLAAAPAGQLAAHDGLESVDSRWISPAQALAAAEDGSSRVEFATRRNLEKLGRAASVDKALAAARTSRIVTVLPVIEEGPHGVLAHLPAAADYGATVFDFAR
jgi:8-oxo-dGTP pyrophosphatase MutT (NUDIX family)